MISTVTTVAISAVSSASLGGSLALVAILALLAFLVQKEMIVVTTGTRAKALSRALSVAILPLLIGVGLIAIMKIGEFLH